MTTDSSPEHATTADFPTIEPRVVNALAADCGAYIWGPGGTGKSEQLHVVVAQRRAEAARGLEHAGMPQAAEYITESDLLEELRCAATSETAYRNTVARLSAVDVLAIDDVGAVDNAESCFVRAYASLLKERALKTRPTIFASRLPFDMIASQHHSEVVDAILAAMRCGVVSGAADRFVLLPASSTEGQRDASGAGVGQGSSPTTLLRVWEALRDSLGSLTEMFEEADEHPSQRKSPRDFEREAAAARMVGQEIRRARESRGWTQASLADAVNAISEHRWSQSLVSRYETGLISAGVGTLAKIAEALDAELQVRFASPEPYKT